MKWSLKLPIASAAIAGTVALVLTILFLTMGDAAAQGARAVTDPAVAHGR